MIGKGANRSTAERDHPDGHPFPQQRDAEHRPVLRKFDGFCPSIFGVFENVGNVHHFALKRGTPGNRPSPERYRILLLIFYEIAGISMSGRKMKEIAELLEDESKIRVAQPCSRRGQRIQHRLQIEGRSANDLQHFRGGGLPSQRLVALAC